MGVFVLGKQLPGATAGQALLAALLVTAAAAAVSRLHTRAAGRRWLAARAGAHHAKTGHNQDHPGRDEQRGPTRQA